MEHTTDLPVTKNKEIEGMFNLKNITIRPSVDSIYYSYAKNPLWLEGETC